MSCLIIPSVELSLSESPSRLSVVPEGHVTQLVLKPVFNDVLNVCERSSEKQSFSLLPIVSFDTSTDFCQITPSMIFLPSKMDHQKKIRCTCRSRDTQLFN